MIRLLFALVVFWSSCSAQAVGSVGGTEGMWTDCTSSQNNSYNYFVSYFGSDPAAMQEACLIKIRERYFKTYGTATIYTLTFIRCPSRLICEYNVKYLTVSTGITKDLGTYVEQFKYAVLPGNASCTSGVFDANTNSCFGGTAVCPSGIEKVLTFKVCLASNVRIVDGEPSCEGRDLPLVKVASSEGCQYKGPNSVDDCFQSKINPDIYCRFKYTSTGYGAGVGAGLSEAEAGATGASDPANRCTTAGGCGSSALAIMVPAADGTSGGTGVVQCGGNGQPSCQGGLESGTTSCGAVGQPACPAKTSFVAASTGDSSGTGTSEATDAEIKKISDFLTTGDSTVPAVPVAATRNELLDAGLSGGTAFADLMHWRLPEHSSVCPTGSFALFGKVVTLDAHCSMVDDIRSNFRLVMSIVFALAALFIVLKA